MALLPSQYLDSVVSIGVKIKEDFNALATGFLVGFLTGKKDDQGNSFQRPCLVTNRHVFKGKKLVTIRFNYSESGSKTYDLSLEDVQGKPLWMTHPNEDVDIAIMPINPIRLKDDGIKFLIIPEEKIAYLDTIRKRGITQGDGVFILGFPMGIAGEGKNYVIVRAGIISRLDKELIEKGYFFLIDAQVFPGNSGGPVILKPEVASIEGTEAVSTAYLIGVVSGYLPYREKAVSEQTGEPRIEFVENSGIATVVPMDFVKETIQPFLNYTKEKEE